MEMLIVQGGAPLQGSTSVSGSKNAALPIMAAALAASGKTILHQAPDVADVRTLGLLLESLGAQVARRANGAVEIEVQDESNSTAQYDLVRRMRASVCVLGPLLARRGKACVSLPGGCNIGQRPIDLHLKGLAALGAEIELRNGYVHASAPRLRGARIFLAGPQGSTVTGTCNVMSAAALAQGTTVIEAAACEPEVVALADYLNAMGARISGHGTPIMVIDGVDELTAAEFTVIPDRIEAATLLIAGAMTRGQVSLTNVRPDHLTAVLEALGDMGVDVTSAPAPVGSTTAMTVQAPETLRPCHLSALPYPGLPTDVQAQFAALLCLASGSSVVRDLVFPDRFMHVSELCRMGASIRQQDCSAIVSGSARLTGAEVMASDLRASAALVLAGLAAQGTTVIRRIYHLDRGYERLENKLNRLGADVRRVQDAAASGRLQAWPPIWTEEEPVRKKSA